MNKIPYINRIKRVDIQVCVFTAIIVGISLFCIYQFSYQMTYRDMLNSLRDRSYAIYNYVDQKWSGSDFEGSEDMDSKTYISRKAILDEIREITDVKYLYTAKEKEDGSLIYVIDGLPSDDADFRDPGDAIEPEICDKLKTALSGEIVWPEGIVPTEWGEIFVTYFPIHKGGEIVEALGIEFNADHQYKTFQTLRTVTPVIGVGICILSSFVAFGLFRRISNPNYKDLSNSDYLTGLKSRNAMEVDMTNLDLKQMWKDVTVVSIDLNGLKTVNDTIGHQAGDACIKAASSIIERSVAKGEIPYRAGGDEFVILMLRSTPVSIREFLRKIEYAADHMEKDDKRKISFAIGYATFDAAMDHSIRDTYKRADELMYRDKRYKKYGGQDE